MSTPEPRKLPPSCPGCGRFLRSPDEQRRGHCSRCPAPAPDASDAYDRPCCHSEPPCDDCPLLKEAQTL